MVIYSGLQSLSVKTNLRDVHQSGFSDGDSIQITLERIISGQSAVRVQKLKIEEYGVMVEVQVFPSLLES